MINIAVDFDGTLVDHRFPEIGPPVPGAFDWLRKIQEHAGIMLWTMRSDSYLSDAINFVEENGIALLCANVNPSQRSWTSSPKLYAPIYIDDAAFGCPLKRFSGFERPAVDWSIVGPAVLNRVVNQG